MLSFAVLQLSFWLAFLEHGTARRSRFLNGEKKSDGLSRMRKRIEYSWSGAGWAPASETRYVYDGRRVIQERNSSDVPQVAYTRGNDLSGSFEGAGGIGLLLARASGYSAGSWSMHNHYHADGVGNITALVDSSTQLVSASYRYNAYGNLLSSSGTMASANTYRFSSKEIIASAGIYYYGFRFYEPNFQRWLNQDPLGEADGINVYGFVQNAPVNRIDTFGLACWNPFNPEFWAHFIEKSASTGQPKRINPNSNLALLAEEGIAPEGFQAPDGTKVSGAKVVALVGGAVMAGTLSAMVDGAGGTGRVSGAAKVEKLASQSKKIERAAEKTAKAIAKQIHWHPIAE